MSAIKDNQRDSGEEDRKLEGGVLRQESGPPAPAKDGLHPAVYIGVWIACSSGVIIFNKWVLATAKFNFPLFLTTWHMFFATVMTQIMAKFTTTLDSRHKVPMTTQTYIRAIVPIGIMFSLSLICGNVAYLYLSVSFIQMLKATNAVVTLFATWAFGIAPPNMKVLGNVGIIVLGVVIASFGEIKFDLVGFVYQCSGIVFEALRLVMIQRMLSSAEFKMDPLVSLYYYAPACALINGVVTLVVEAPRMTMGDIYNVGLFTLVANAFVAFLLNVSVVFLIGKTSAVVLTMSGILKDILLVCASLVIFHDPVTLQQYFGYSIALGGLCYYKLGAEKLQSALTDARLHFGSMRHNHPARAKGAAGFLVFGGILFAAYLFWPSLHIPPVVITPSG
ncbi:triose-phosphate transporter family-domain-containing protein [Coniella lustricola]|uniref:Triose-phosphate transporter family-domain-containing protein n=1 Tax=Coniella lustricola TaxID=2025994 RepID=A0A2T3A0X9_9PEZI|nr:triose-phosphate transporter family-domain-containing protein [Coniella lustricola]